MKVSQWHENPESPSGEIFSHTGRATRRMRLPVSLPLPLECFFFHSFLFSASTFFLLSSINCGKAKEIFRKTLRAAFVVNEELRWSEKSLTRPTKTCDENFNPTGTWAELLFAAIRLPLVWLPLLAQLGFDDISGALEVKHERLVPSSTPPPTQHVVVRVSLCHCFTVAEDEYKAKKGKFSFRCCSRKAKSRTFGWMEEKSIIVSGVCFSLLEMKAGWKGGCLCRRKKLNVEENADDDAQLELLFQQALRTWLFDEFLISVWFHLFIIYSGIFGVVRHRDEFMAGGLCRWFEKYFTI